MYQGEWNDSSGSTWSSDLQFDNFDLYDKGIVFKLNFNKSFPVTADFADIFGSWTNGPQTNDPPFRSGFMFADDYEFYTFG